MGLMLHFLQPGQHFLQVLRLCPRQLLSLWEIQNDIRRHIHFPPQLQHVPSKSCAAIDCCPQGHSHRCHPKGSLRNNISTTNLVATWHVVVTSPMSGAQSTLQVHNPRSQTHTLTSTLVHLVAHYSHCLPQHLRLTPGKRTPTLCGASHVRQLRRFGLNVYPLLCSQFCNNLAAIAWYELCIVNNNTWHTSNKCQLIPGGIIILRSKG